MTDMIDAAHDYLKHGWQIVPLYGWDGTSCGCGNRCIPKSRGKHPSRGNKWQNNPLTSGADVQVWYEDHPDDNIGIATGKDSGIWVLDLDGADGIRTLTELTAEHGPLPLTRIVRTGSGGLHYYWRHPADFEPRGSNGMIGPGVDVRGWHGQVVAPPSVSARGAYELLAAHPVTDAPEWLLNLVREHAETVVAGANIIIKNAERVDVEFLPANILDLAGTLIEEDQGRYKHFHALVAACYEAGYSQGQTVTIAAPWCAAVGKFVGRVESEVARSWGKLVIEAAKANEWVEGIAGPGANTPPTTDGANALQPNPEPDTANDDDTQQDILDPTWRPVDLQPILTGTYTPEEPTLLPRSDGRHLLYPGRVHSFHGESESGKSLVAQAETARLLKDTESYCLYIDFESDALSVVSRLRDLGAPDPALRDDFTYIRPDNDPRKFAHERQELTAVLRTPYTLIIIDGVTDALGVFGAGSKDNDEIAHFMRTFPRMLARKTGAAVVLIDHVTKDADSRGRYALGGQAKMNALDGSAFTVEVIEPLGRGMRGTVSLRVAKDRPGGVRPHAGPFRKSDRTQEAARVVFDSTGNSIDVTVEPPHGHVGDERKPGAGRLTGYMQDVSVFLERATEPVSWNTIRNGVGRTEKYVKSAVATLIAEGYIREEDGPNNAKLHTLLKPYSEALDELAEGNILWTEQASGAGGAGGAEWRGGGAEATGEVVARRPPSPTGGRATHATTKTTKNSSSGAAIGCHKCGDTEAPLERGLCAECAP